MKKRIVAVVLLVALALVGGSCAKIKNKLKMPKTSDGNPTAETHFTFVLNDDETGYIIARKEKDVLPAIVNIPSEYNGKPVTAIAKEGFLNIETISTLNIPATVQVIGDYAFKGCKNLGTVNFGVNKTVEDGKYKESQHIGAFAFDGCSLLSTVDASCVKTIGAHAFRGCKSSLKINNLVSDAVVSENYKD